jgi:hypothetical protein
MTLRLPEELDAALTARAERENLSKNKMIERIVAAHVDDDVRPMTQRRAHILALAAALSEQDADVLERLA